MIKTKLLFILFISLFSLPVEAREFRDIQRLNKPSADGITNGKIIKPVEKTVVESVVEKIFNSYNTPEFDSLLSKNFYNKDRLTTAIDEKVPKDAAMRVLGIRGVETLGQTLQGNRLVSTVSVTVKAQMEFNNASGFQRRESTNELILKITQDAP